MYEKKKINSTVNNNNVKDYFILISYYLPMYMYMHYSSHITNF
jgi:hypothetical protein